MSEEIYQHKLKSELLLKELGGYGYSKSNKISQSEIILFLDLRSSKRKFDRNLATQLFKILDMNERTILSIEQFINGYLEFEKVINSNYEKIKSEYADKNEKYQNLLFQCKRYQSEELNREGFSENGKLYGKIIDINLKKKLEGVKEIILKIIFGEQNKEIKQRLINQIEIVKDESNQSFEFKADSKKNDLEFILQAKNDLGHIYDLGKKTYSLNDVNKQEKFSDGIEIYEINNNSFESLFAEIKFEMTLIWSYFKLYDLQRRIEEPKFKKIKADYEEAENKLKMIKRVYSEEEVEEEVEKSEIIGNKKEIEIDGNLRLSNNNNNNNINTSRSNRSKNII